MGDVATEGRNSRQYYSLGSVGCRVYGLGSTAAVGISGNGSR